MFQAYKHYILAFMAICFAYYYFIYDDFMFTYETIEIEPIQEPIEEPFTLSFDHDFTVRAISTFDIQARVLGVERYYFDEESSFSPIDFALGWQKMSEDFFVKDIKITQSNRFYYYFYNGSHSKGKDIASMSANMHIIPSNEKVKAEINSIRKHDFVHLKGFLVQVKERSSGRTWKSSLTRHDRGAGACEIIYVESVEKIL